MKTQEFKIHPTSTQIQKFEGWMETLKLVWNRGLDFLEWRQHWIRLQKCLEVEPEKLTGWKFGEIHPVVIRAVKTGDAWGYCCDIMVKTRIDRTKSWDSKNTEWRFARRIVKPHWTSGPPPIAGYDAISLRKPFAKKLWDSGDLPTVYINDYIGLVLADAWKDYLNPKLRAYKPKEKKDRHRVNSISCASFKAHGRLGGDLIKLPALDEMEIPGLDNRVGHRIRQQQQRMLNNPQGYPELIDRLAEGDAYLQVASWLENGSELPDPEQIEDKFLKKAIKQAIKVISKDQDAVVNLRQHAENRQLEPSIAHLTKPGWFCICRKATGWYLQIAVPVTKGKRKPRSNTIAVDVGTDLLYETTTDIQVKHLDFTDQEKKIAAMQKALARKKYGSGQWHRLNNRISRLKEQMKRDRRSWHHLHSSWLVEANGTIVTKEIDMEETVGRPLARPGDSGYLPNNASKAHEQNREILSKGIGQFVGLIEQKASERGRLFERVKVSPEASPDEVLTVSQNSLAGVLTGQKPGSDGLGQSEQEVSIARANKRHGKDRRSALPDRLVAHAPEQVSRTKTPKARKGRKRRPSGERKVV